MKLFLESRKKVSHLDINKFNVSPDMKLFSIFLSVDRDFYANFTLNDDDVGWLGGGDGGGGNERSAKRPTNQNDINKK